MTARSDGGDWDRSTTFYIVLGTASVSAQCVNQYTAHKPENTAAQITEQQ